MVRSSEKDFYGDRLRAAERAKENQYFAKIDEQLLAKIRAAQQEEAAEKSAPPDHGGCPRCDEPLRAGLWRELEIEFCPSCRGVWLDQGDLLDLANREDVDLHIAEPPDDA